MKYIRSLHFNQFHRSTAERTSRSRNHCAIHIKFDPSCNKMSKFSLWISQPVLKSPEITLKYYINLYTAVCYMPAVKRKDKDKGSDHKKSGKQHKACWDMLGFLLDTYSYSDKV